MYPWGLQSTIVLPTSYRSGSWICPWIHLILNNIEQADHFSDLAYKQAPDEHSILGTRASVLIEKGQTDRGIGLLLLIMDFKFANSATLSVASYLMLGYHLNGDRPESQKYLEFVKENYEKLNPDEKVLFERNLSKIAPQQVEPTPPFQL
jgi:hypothetical protein